MRTAPLWLVLFTLASPEVHASSSPPLTVRVTPETVYSEGGAEGTSVSCNIEITSSAAEPWDVATLLARGFSADGSLIVFQKVDSNGTRPSIEALGPRRVEPNQTLTVFPPFAPMRTAVPVARLEYTIVLRSPSGARQSLRAEVRPVPFRQKTRLILPVAGARLWAYDGPGFLSHHRRVDLAHPMNRDVLKLKGNSQRYALDLVVVDEKGEYARGDDEKKESWLGFGVPVVTPGEGTVVEAEGSLADDIPFDEAKMRENPRATVGNHVILDHGNGEYSLLAHFRNGSLRVKAGDKVRPGQVLGEMSRSGMGSQLVHVHYELRTSPDLMSGEGLPASFEGFRRIGAKRTEPGPLEAGAVVLTDRP